MQHKPMGKDNVNYDIFSRHHFMYKYKIVVKMTMNLLCSGDA